MAAGKKIGRKSQASNDFLEPLAPTGVTATNVGTGRAFNNGAATVSFSLPALSPNATSFTVTASTGQTGTGSASPVTVAGLPSASSVTFTVTATNAAGTSAASSASAAISITTVPATPSAPSASSPSAGVDTVSWTAPANGGLAITNFFFSSSDGKSGNTGTSTSVNVNQEQGTSQTYTVRADNANGSSLTSVASPSVTTVYSFVPYSFVPYSFTPYSFTPYSFTPYSFTPFQAFGAFGAFAAFGAFSAFGAFGAFSAFGAFGAYSFTPSASSPVQVKSIGVDTLVLTQDGYALAKNLKVGDVLVSTALPGLGEHFTTQEMENWTYNPETMSVTADKLTTIMEIGTSTASRAVMVGNEVYSGSHWMLANRDGVAQMIMSENLLETDQLWSSDSNSWADIPFLNITDINHEVVSINCEPSDLFFTDHYLVYDGYQIEY